MPFTLVQAGSTLVSVNSDGGLSAPLTLPTSVTLATNLVPRFAKFPAGLRSYVVLVNTPTYAYSTGIPLSIDDGGVVRLITPPAPTVPVIAAASGTGVLSGAYMYLQTFVIKDALGNDIAESDFSPFMGSAVSPSAQEVVLTLQVSSASGISARRIYRTTSNGAVYFQLTDINDNTTTTYTDNTPDASLPTLAVGVRGSAPDLTLVSEFAGRLWGVDRQDVDHLRYTEAGTMFAWSLLNTLTIPHVGADAAGITALMPRRDALGVARRDMLLQVTGTDRTNFRPVVVNGGEQVGCVSQESAVVFNDIAYFLFRDGVYQWDSRGVTCLTNGTVRSWFTSDTYFNRSMFWRSFAIFDQFNMKYRLFLASPGSAVNNLWVEYDILTGTWWGPHKTSAFTPTSAVLVAGTNMQPYPMIGSQEGYISQDQDAKNDWGFSPIDFDVITRKYYNSEPDYEKYWGEMSINGKAQPGNMTITPSVGELDSEVVQTPFIYDQTQGRERLGRIGVGKEMSIEFEQNGLNQDALLYEFEINPVSIIGRR